MELKGKKFDGKKIGRPNITGLYSNPCENEVWTAPGLGDDLKKPHSLMSDSTSRMY